MTPLKKWLLAGLVSVLLVLGAAVAWLLHSESGAAWIWRQLEDNSNGAIKAEQVEGRLSAGFVAKNLVFVSEGMEIRVGHASIEAGPGWWPLSVEIRSLDLLGVQIVTLEPAPAEQEDDPGLDIRMMLAELKLPVAVELRNALVRNVTLQQGDEVDTVFVDSLAFRASLDESLTIDNFVLITGGNKVDLNASLFLEPPYDLAASLNGRLAAGVDGPVLPLALDGSGNLDAVRFSLASDEYGLRLDGDLNNLLQVPSWNVKGSLEHLQWPPAAQAEATTLTGLAIASTGSIDDWSGSLASGVQYGALQIAMLQLSATGDAKGLELSDASLTGDGIELTASGTLGWSAGFEATMEAVIDRLDVSPWLEDWQAGEFLEGAIELNWSNSAMRIPSARLAVTGTDLAVDIEADIDIGANRVSALLDWRGLAWPPAVDSPAFASPSGSLELTGSLDQWQAGGAMSLRLGDYPDGQLQIDARGNRTAANADILSGAVLGGSFRGEVAADWSDALSWNALIHARGIDPEPLLKGWPGKLDADFTVAAQDQLNSLDFKLQELQGMLRGVAIEGKGGVLVENGSATFNNFLFSTGDAVLQVDGSTASSDGARFSFDGQLPSKLLDNARGSLELQGRLSQNGTRPLIEMQMEGLDLAWSGISVRALSASASEANAALPELRLEAAELRWEDVEIDEFSLSLDPGDPQQEVSINMMAGNLQAVSALSLARQRPDTAGGQQWLGSLEELRVEYDQSHHLELVGAAPFEWSSGELALRPVCLREDSGAGLCVSGNYKSVDELALAADLSAVPLDYLREIFDLDVAFNQLVDGRFEWRQFPGQAAIGGAGFKISAGAILDLESKEPVAETSAGRLEFALQNGNLESGRLDLRFPEIGYIDVDFEVLDIVRDGNRSLRGKAVSQFDDIGLFGQLALPGIDEMRGRFESDIELGGSLADPAFSGRFSLSEGMVRYAPLGLKLEGIEFAGLLDRRDRGSLQGRFRAGGGNGSIDGNFVFTDVDRLQMNLALAGERLMFINTDNLKIETDTSLEFRLGPERVDINGRVLVPHARLTPENLLVETVSDSEDLVIENPQAKPAAGGGRQDRVRQFFGELEVAFGDDVLVKVPGVETSVGGSVLFKWNGDPVPLAEGNYLLNGLVDVYGPRLTIDNGRISFPRVPADNPLLSIRAEREIFGNTQIRSAGVQVIGSLKKPVLEAYTVPVTNEDRAWSLLITGSDFDQGQGVGGFDVGTYIAPRLYVSYGVSLFEEENVVSARYDLKKGFGIKVTSGQRETGLDVSYTIDR